MRSIKSIRPFLWLALALVGAVIVGTLGCSRRQFRQKADSEVHDLVAEKSNDLGWELQGFSVELDPRSRYYDPYDPDHPPMPPDDPASHQYMHWVDCKKGWPRWHRNGDRIELENPCWRDYLPDYAEMNEKDEVILTVDSALRLTYMHSPSYQRQLETIYLSALDVSAERFRLDTQFFGGTDTTQNHSGELGQPRLIRGNGVIPGARIGDSNTHTTATDVQLRRQFATAGQMLVGFANQFTWEFTSGGGNLAGSIANLSLVQPLLRGAGRDVAMERLTIVERLLLGNLRAFERYRHGLYTGVVVGDSVSGPTRRGGFLGNTGLTGFTGTGSGGLGGVGEATGFGRGGFGGAGGAGAGGGGAGFAGGGEGQVSGLLGLLQRLQQIRNTEDSLNLKLRTLRLLEAYLDAGVIDLAQVDQFRQNIETDRANLLQEKDGLLLAQHNYVMGTLGLPPKLPVVLDDQVIRQFQLVAPQTSTLQAGIAEFQDELGELPEEPELNSLEDLLKRLVGLRQQFEERLTDIEGDRSHMEQMAVERAETMTDAERSLFQKERKLLADSLADLQTRFQGLSPKLDSLRDGLLPDTRPQTTADLVVWLGEMYRLAGEAMLVQGRIRLESVVVEPVELDSETAFQIALANRLDIMNSRAELVDTWRLIAFNADALQSQVNVVLDGDISTARNNPVSFRAPTGTLRAGVQFDAPLTRLLERNNYRQSLIDYQRDRRTYIQSMDSVDRNLSNSLRNLERLRINLEIQRRAAAISIRRVDLTQEELNEPAAPAEPGQPAVQFGPTAARNFMDALSDLRNTQNNLMSVWLNHYAYRMVLMRELGVMQLDEQGHWIDVPISELEFEPLDGVSPPPAVPLEWLDQAFRDEGPEPDRREGVQLQPVSAQTFQVTDEAVPAEGEPNVPDDEPEETPATEEAKTADESVGDQILRFLGRR
ncbi:MAG: TolC family protein [Planctomycetes bacterium]|nr:TolC family protein [Planctomycetota bacterium]MBL7039531.1 TolC family protein [Pirellulaceae bacterium]